MARLFLFALLVSLGTGRSVAAKPKIVVLPVVPLRGEVEAAPAEQMTRAIMDEFGQSADVEAVQGEAPAVAVTGPDTGRRPPRSDAEYRAALADLKEGARQAQRLRFPQAIRALRQGIDGLTRNLDLLDDYDRLLDAYVLMAVAYFRRGKQSAGTDALETVARLRPDYSLEAGDYPPVFVSVFEQARERALSRTRGSLRVTSAPEGAEVLLNGRKLGTTPLLVEEVIPGKHHLVVRVGDSVWARVVDVRERETSTQHADLGAGGPQAPVTMGDAIAANRFDRQVRRTARKLARDMGADFILLEAMGRAGSMYSIGCFLGETKTGKWVQLPSLSPDLDLLSDTIEAHSLVREVVKQVSDLGETAPDQTLAFVSGKAVGSGKRGAGLKETRVAYVSSDVTAAGSRPGTSRGPIQATGRSPVAPPTAVTPVTSTASAATPVTSARRPIGARVEEPKPKVPNRRRAPLTRSSAGRGAVVAGSIDAEVAEVTPPSKVEDDIAAVEASAATVPAPEGPAASGSGPLAAPTSLEEEASWIADDSLLREWWFWGAVAGGVLVAGAGIWAGVELSKPDAVTVRAVW